MLTISFVLLAIILFSPQVSLLGNIRYHVRTVRSESLGLVFESQISEQGGL